MADIFVSYSRSDKARVTPLVTALEAEGWSVWWDPAIDPGQQFDRMIADELERARAVLVVWTADSVESRWVRGEARDGADRGILVPVRFGSARLPIDFRAFHTPTLDHPGDVTASPQFREVLLALEALLGRAAPRTAGRIHCARPQPWDGVRASAHRHLRAASGQPRAATRSSSISVTALPRTSSRSSRAGGCSPCGRARPRSSIAGPTSTPRRSRGS